MSENPGGRPVSRAFLQRLSRVYTYDGDDDGATLVNEPSEFSVSHVCCIRKKDECHFGEIIQRTLIRGIARPRIHFSTRPQLSLWVSPYLPGKAVFRLSLNFERYCR